MVSWFLFTYESAPFCGKCGKPILTKCPNPECDKPLPAGENIGEWVPYYNHCPHCGQPFPWRADAIEVAKRALEEAAEVDDWNVATKERAMELVDDISADKATASSIETSLKWLAQRGAKGAKSIIIDAVRSIGSNLLAAALRSHGMLPPE